MIWDDEISAFVGRVKNELMYSRASVRSYIALLRDTIPAGAECQIEALQDIVVRFDHLIAGIDSAARWHFSGKTSGGPSARHEKDFEGSDGGPLPGDQVKRLCPRKGCGSADIVVTESKGFECQECGAWFDIDEGTGGVVFAYDHLPPLVSVSVIKGGRP